MRLCRGVSSLCSPGVLVEVHVGDIALGGREAHARWMQMSDGVDVLTRETTDTTTEENAHVCTIHFLSSFAEMIILPAVRPVLLPEAAAWPGAAASRMQAQGQIPRATR